MSTVATGIERAHDARSVARREPTPSLREGTPTDAPGILQLVEENLAAGHLLPRTLEDLTRHASRFLVLEHDGVIVGCAELAPLSRAVAEVRSLVVDGAWRGRGLGTLLIEDLGRRARTAGFAVLCAFAHEPQPFVRLGFSIVPHVWFAEKVALDCTGCAKFRTCGQYALALPLTGAGLLPSVRRLREPLTAVAPANDGRASLPPVRLRVIA
jgi:N-acetylglutamate synthase-like GNAT family acetyltransferase